MKYSLIRAGSAAIFIITVSGCSAINNAGMRALTEVEARPELAKQPLSEASSFFVGAGVFGESEVRYFQKTGVVERTTTGSVDAGSTVWVAGHAVAGAIEGFSKLDPVWALSALGNVEAGSDTKEAPIEIPAIVIKKSKAAEYDAWFEKKALSVIYDRNGFKLRNRVNGTANVWELLDQKGAVCMPCTRAASIKSEVGDYVVYRALPGNRPWLQEYADANKNEYVSYWPGFKWNGKTCVPVTAILHGESVEIREFSSMCPAPAVVAK